MEARFGRLILQHVDKALGKEPSREALLDLLQIADPSFTEDDIDNETKRSSTLRSLKLLVHPDKHAGGGTATKRFQDTQTFFDKCESCLHRRTKKARKEHRSSKTLPPHFHITDKWPYLENAHKHPIAPNGNVDGKTVQRIIAYKSVNCRGAIAHGKRTELGYGFSCVTKQSGKSAANVFDDHGGHKSFDSADAIKEEIMNRGPVVSTSFRLSDAFLNAGDHAHAFEASLVNQEHAVLIVGWKLTAFGEMWLIRSSKKSCDIPIALGQYSLEEEVLAPSSDFSNKPWQKPQKAFDISMSTDDWYSWSTLDAVVTSEELESIFKILECSWQEVIILKPSLVIRQEGKIARSRYAYPEDIEWVASSKEWSVQFAFCDDKWER